jgi:hypothetical protein
VNEGQEQAVVDRILWNQSYRAIDLNLSDLILRRPRSCAAVSKDGGGHDLACGRPSRRAQERAPQDEAEDDVDMIGTMETQ